MGAPQAVTVFNIQTGAVLQTYSVPYTSSKAWPAPAAARGIAYSPDGKYLLFSQDGGYGPSSYVSIASVNPSTGLLSNYAQVNVPPDVTSGGPADQRYLLPVQGCGEAASGSPAGTSGSFGIPCGYPVSIFSDDTLTSYPEGIAVSPDGKTAYAVLDTNDTLTKIDLTATKPVQGAEVRVGQVPQNVVISPDGKTAYVSNEAGRIATASDFQEYSNGTPIVSEYPTGTTATRHYFRGRPGHV